MVTGVEGMNETNNGGCEWKRIMDESGMITEYVLHYVGRIYERITPSYDDQATMIDYRRKRVDIHRPMPEIVQVAFPFRSD